MLLRSVYDLLPTPINLYDWWLSESKACARCGKTGSLEHILAGCEMSVRQYTWWHNQVLEVLASAAENQCHVKVLEPSGDFVCKKRRTGQAEVCHKGNTFGVKP